MLDTHAGRNANREPAGGAPEPLSPRARRGLLAAARPLERLLRPSIRGLEHVPSGRAVMFVGNHQLLALDSPLLIAALWRHGVSVRPLADDFFFAASRLAPVLERLGLVRASVPAARALLARGESVLVYPGGAREASKGSGHAFELQWWDRLGFASLALELRVAIVTVAAAGVDDRVRVLWSARDLLANPLLSRLVERAHLRPDLIPPIFVPLGLPRPRFKLGPPIEPDAFLAGDLETARRRLRTEVAAQLRADMAALGAPEPAPGSWPV